MLAWTCLRHEKRLRWHRHINAFFHLKTDFKQNLGMIIARHTTNRQSLKRKTTCPLIITSIFVKGQLPRSCRPEHKLPGHEQRQKPSSPTIYWCGWTEHKLPWSCRPKQGYEQKQFRRHDAKVQKVEIFLKIMKIIHAKHEVFWALILAKHKTHTHPNYLHKF